jgi:hypothetical protein
MAIMKEQTWKRHSNPWSVWTRVFTNPLVYVPVWNRSWRQAIPVAAWFLLNPRLFPPKDDSSWATRSVLGEQIWTRKRRTDLPMSIAYSVRCPSCWPSTRPTPAGYGSL